MLPAPTTPASSTPRACTAPICPATASTRSGSSPWSRVPISASPDSFRRIRLNAGGCSGSSAILGVGSGLADGEAREAPDDHVLAGARGELRAQLLDGLVLVLLAVDVDLLEEDDLLEPLADLAARCALARVLGHVGHLTGGDAQLLGADVLGDVLLGHPARRRAGRDVQRDVTGERGEVVVLGDEVGVAVDLDQHADLAVGVDVGLHGALGGLAAAELGGAGDALLAQVRDGSVDVAARLL